MTRKSVTYKPRDDTGFNPFQEALQVIRFADKAARMSYKYFSVYVERGFLHWTQTRLTKKSPGFIATYSVVTFQNGLTSKAWRKLEEKIAIEMCKQRKAW